MLNWSKNVIEQVISKTRSCYTIKRSSFWVSNHAEDNLLNQPHPSKLFESTKSTSHKLAVGRIVNVYCSYCLHVLPVDIAEVARLEQAGDLERKDAHQDCCIYSPDSNANVNKRPATTLCSIIHIVYISVYDTWAWSFSVSWRMYSTNEPWNPSIGKALGSYVDALWQYWDLSKRLNMMLSSWRIKECLIPSSVKLSVSSTLFFVANDLYKSAA